MYKNTLRYGTYAAIVAVVLSLTGMFGKFAARYVVADQVTLSTVLLVLIFGATGYYTASQVRHQGIAAVILNGVVGSLIVGIALALVVVVEANVSLTFVFENLNRNPIGPALTFGQETIAGLVFLLVISALMGALSGLLLALPNRLRQVILSSLALTVIIGLLESQLRQIITLPDVAALTIALSLGYGIGQRFIFKSMSGRLASGAGVGAVFGVALWLLASGGGLEQGGILRGVGDIPHILSVSPVVFPVIFGLAGAVGALITSASRTVHNSLIYVLASLFLFGVLNTRGEMDTEMTALSLVLFGVIFWFIPGLAQRAGKSFEAMSRQQQALTRRLGFGVAIIILLFIPVFLGQYITGVLDLVGLYVMMGIGLNIVIGYAGLLDLGYVAFFAIGAYTVGILTTPSLLTCGGVSPKDLTPDMVAQVCTGIMTFWQAWPFSILVAALAGILLGIPVLRLRGDYLAIVTLGFGEIIRLITLSNEFKPLLGAAQGIARIPPPVIDLTALNPAWRWSLGSAVNIYYVILAGVLITGTIAIRLATTRLGRAWRAMRADEDVAQAMGINLVRSKLLAFAIGAAFAGMGGAVFGSWLQGIFPNSFTVLVSINVVSLIIIGGLGSIPGVIVGALMLIGLPEVLREFQDYRLLAFGVLLVSAMLLRPEGLVPPPVRRLTEVAVEHRRAEEGVTA